MKENYAIQFKNITKKFGNLVANDKININVEQNKIHAIIGENGAGKSTLMNQLFGLLSPTSGRIFINGNAVNIESPNMANELGLSMVHQHFQLVGNHSVLENVILDNKEKNPLKPIDFKYARNKLIQVSSKYNLDINPDQLVKKTSVGVQQRIEILKMLYRGADILIFDEPTAMLTPQEIDGLLRLFIDLKKQGKTIIFISHKLNEIKSVADNGTVIRRGKVVKNFKVKSTSIDKMAEWMVGRKLVPVKNNYKNTSDNKVLEIKNLYTRKYSNSRVYGIKDINLDIFAGEILAIAGVEGNGQLELVNSIFGLQKVSKGSITFYSEKNEPITLKSGNVNQRYLNNISLVPEDRYKYAMLSQQNLFINAIMQTYKFRPYQKFGFLFKRPRNKYALDIINTFDVRGSKAGTAIIGELSGGNQQKFIMGREILRNNRLTILFQPTRGLDIGAIEFIHKKSLEEKAKGNAVLLVSYDLGEVISISDRIAVLNSGNLINVTSTKNTTREEIGKWMAGVK